MDWLQLLAVELDEEEIAVLRRDLRQALLDEVGLDPHNGYMLVPADEDFEVRRAGAERRMEALLVGPDGHGRDVSLAWTRTRAWWTLLPQPEDPAELVAGDWPFPVRVTPYAWPDVWIAIVTERAPAVGDDRRLMRCLADWRDARNRTGPGVVHDISEPHVSSECIEIHVDFGSAPPDALQQIIGALADAPLLAGIARIDIAGSAREAPRAE